MRFANGWSVALCALATCAALGGVAHAQISSNLGGLTSENVEGYLEPLPKALSGTLNLAVFDGADIPLAGLNVSLGVKAMAVGFDDEDRVYRPSVPDGFQTGDVSTVVGDGESTYLEGDGGLQIGFPGGLDIETFAVAVPQLTVGSVLGTRAVIRYIAVELDDTELGDLELIGYGLQHSISQYLGPLFPVNIAAGFFIQSFKVGEDLIESDALHLNVMGSKSFGTFEPYVGLGFDSYTFDVSYDDTLDDTDEMVKVEFSSENDFHATLGVAAHFALVHTHLELTSAASLGLAFGLRVGL